MYIFMYLCSSITCTCRRCTRHEIKVTFDRVKVNHQTQPELDEIIMTWPRHATTTTTTGRTKDLFLFNHFLHVVLMPGWTCCWHGVLCFVQVVTHPSGKSGESESLPDCAVRTWQISFWAVYQDNLHDRIWRYVFID